MLAALGVTHICGELPSRSFDEKWSVASLVALRKHIESFGIRLAMLPLPLSSNEISQVEFRNIMLGKSPDRDREIEHICRIIRNCAEAGVPAVKYNLSMLGVVRTAPTAGRGARRYSTLFGQTSQGSTAHYCRPRRRKDHLGADHLFSGTRHTGR